MKMEDVKDASSIAILIDDFYGKVRADILLGPIFSVAIKDDWQTHLDKMYIFWNAALFGIPGYEGNPFARNVSLPLAAGYFVRWIKLFAQTIDEHFEGPKASETKAKAGLMLMMFQRRQPVKRDSLTFML